MHDEGDDREQQEQMNHRAGHVKKDEGAQPADHEEKGESEKDKSHKLEPPRTFLDLAHSVRAHRQLSVRAGSMASGARGATAEFTLLFFSARFGSLGDVFRSGARENFRRCPCLHGSFAID